LIGQSERIVSELIKKGKLSDNYSELKPLADLLFIDRYCTDKNLEKEIIKGKLLSTEHIDELSKLSEDVRQEEYKNYYGFEKQLIGLGYTFAEIEELLADIPGRTNTYVGVKDVEVNVTKQLLKDSEIAREIQRLKRAGIHKVVLLKDKDVSNKELYTTILRIRKSGLQPIIAITKEMLSVRDPKTQEDFYNLIEESSRFKALAGFRFKVDINDNIRNLLQENLDNKESILELMKKSGKEISYKPSNFDNLQEMEKADKLFEGKVIFVVEGKQIIDEEGAETEIKFSDIISMLAGEGRFSLYFDTDKEENLKIIKELVEKIFGKGAEATKTMISLGTTYTANMFAELFKKDVASKSFSNAYELGYEPIFGNVSPEIVAGAFKKVLTGEKNYNEFIEYKKSDEFEYKNAITNEFENIVLSSIDKDKTLKPEEQTAMLRQYVMGFMISYIEKHFDEFYEIPEWDKIIDIKQMDINVKNQIIYRIIYLLLAGNSPETIKNNLSDVDKNQQKEGSMEEIVRNIKNNDMSKEISQMQIKTDSVIPADKISDKNIVSFDIYNDIKILLEDNLLPIATNKPGRLDLIRATKSIQKKA
jgi:hypothetical protein